MTGQGLTESVVEQVSLAWLESIGWQISHGPDLMPDERADYGAVVLEGRLRNAIARLNPELPTAACDSVFTTLTQPSGF